MAHGVFFLVVAALIAVTTLSAAATDSEVVLVQITHRHGARTPIVHDAPQLQDAICGPLGCGILTHNGKMMLTALGQWLNARYAKNTLGPTINGHEAVPPSSSFTDSFGKQNRYHMRKLTTRSTQVLRTMQSADSLIRGFVNNDSDVFPVIHTVAYDEDTLLHAVNMLSMVIPYELGENECVNKIPKSWATSRISPAEAKEIAVEFGFTAGVSCSTLTAESSLLDWFNCTDPLNGALLCNAAQMGETAVALKYPKAWAKRQQLGEFLAMVRHCQFVEVSKEQGAILYNLVNRYVENMNTRVQELIQGSNDGNDESHNVLIYEFSAHDTTVAPLATALGHPNLMLPAFGQAIITELVRDKSKKVDDMSAYSIRHWTGTPSNIFSPPNNRTSVPGDYAYDSNFRPLDVICVDSVTGALKNASNGNSCTLADFAKYTETMLKPSDPSLGGAPCYINKTLFKKFGCDTNDAVTASDTNAPWCVRYRAACPAWACADAANYIYDVQTGMCVMTRFEEPVLRQTMAGLIYGTTVAGAVIGAIILVIVQRVSTVVPREALKSDSLAK